RAKVASSRKTRSQRASHPVDVGLNHKATFMIKALGVSGSLLLGGLVVFLALAVSPASAADFSKPGPFAIGVQKFAIPGVTGEPLPQTYVWYPATGPAPDAAASILSTPDAPPATTGPYPLVVLISGLSIPAITYSRWGEFLASY